MGIGLEENRTSLKKKKRREPKYLGVPIAGKKGQNSWKKGEHQAPNTYEKYELMWST